MKVKGFRIHERRPIAIPYKRKEKHTVPNYISKLGPAPCGWCKEGPAQWPVRSRGFTVLDFSTMKEAQNKGRLANKVSVRRHITCKF